MKAVLLVGSPRGPASASRALGLALTRRLEAAGLTTVEMTAAAALSSTREQHRLHKAIDAAELLIVSFPLYVDSLPAPLVQTLQLVADRRRGDLPASPAAGPLAQRLVAIVQCGFPEVIHNRVAVEIMRLFAKEAGFAWAGALIMGMGGALSGQDLDKGGGMIRNVAKALDLAARSLAAGSAVPAEAAALMAKPLMPRWLYLLAANMGFRRSLKKHGALKRAFDRPDFPS